jgi:hypothetical protein
VVESGKIQLLRDFRHRSVFDFCNTIGQKATSKVRLALAALPQKADVVSLTAHVGLGPILLQKSKIEQP